MISLQEEYHAAAAAGRDPHKPTQCALILTALQQRVGEWVPMPELYQLSGAWAVHSRISDLRRAGHQIEHRNEWHGGQCHSFYRLVVAP